MGEAIILNVRKHFFVSVSEKGKKRRQYLHRRYKLVCRSISELARISGVIIVAVKPQDIDEVLSELSRVLTKDKVVISIAAGITTAFIERSLKGKPRVIRTMPNMPALIGQGITAVAKGRFARPGDAALACRIFGHLGETVVVKETLLDAVTAVSGSGPAYVFLFIECLIKAAVSLGLKKDLAADLIKATFAGSVNLLLKENIDPAALRAKVTSKGGTTHAALKVFMDRKIDEIIEQALKAAKKRAKALSRR